MKEYASSLERGLMVLECFTPKHGSYTLAELTKQLNVPKSSLRRVVMTLSKMNYLRYDEEAKRYYLGVGVLSLGFAVLESMDLREIARPYMEKFSRECNKTVNMAVLDKDEMVYVERIRVPGIRSFNISIGSRVPLWNTAVGRAVLAYLEPPIVRQMMDRGKASGEYQGDDDELFRILTQVRSDGFAIDDQELIRGILAVGAPIFSSRGVDGAINVIVEPEDVSAEELKRVYAPKLLKLCRQLSEALGYRSRQGPEVL